MLVTITTILTDKNKVDAIPYFRVIVYYIWHKLIINKLKFISYFEIEVIEYHHCNMKNYDKHRMLEHVARIFYSRYFRIAFV